MNPTSLLPPAGASAQAMEICIAGKPQEFLRLPEAPPAAAPLAATLCGRYRSRDYGIEIEIIEGKGKLLLDFLPAAGKALWELQPLSPDVLLCGELDAVPALPLPWPGSIVLDYRDGRVTGFWQSAERVRGLRFDRA